MYCKRRKSSPRFPDRKARNRLYACHCIAGNAWSWSALRPPFPIVRSVLAGSKEFPEETRDVQSLLQLTSQSPAAVHVQSIRVLQHEPSVSIRAHKRHFAEPQWPKWPFTGNPHAVQLFLPSGSSKTEFPGSFPPGASKDLPSSILETGHNKNKTKAWKMTREGGRVGLWVAILVSENCTWSSKRRARIAAWDLLTTPEAK